MERGERPAYLVGTMIELPRAALRAGEIAEGAEFFSFGTNDLTQTTFGISRDDAAAFLDDYIRHEIFVGDPFVSLDVDGVGELVETRRRTGAAGRGPISSSESAASTAATRPRSRSAIGIGLDYVIGAPPIGCPSPASPPPRPRWGTTDDNAAVVGGRDDTEQTRPAVGPDPGPARICEEHLPLGPSPVLRARRVGGACSSWARRREPRFTRAAYPGTIARVIVFATGSPSIARPSTTSAGSPSCRWVSAIPGGTRTGATGRPVPSARRNGTRRFCPSSTGVELTLLVGSYAPGALPRPAPRPHRDRNRRSLAGVPSRIPPRRPTRAGRTTAWVRRNPWFEADLLPELRGPRRRRPGLAVDAFLDVFPPCPDLFPRQQGEGSGLRRAEEAPASAQPPTPPARPRRPGGACRVFAFVLDPTPVDPSR